MEVKDLKVKQGNVDLILDIVDIGEVREFERFGRKGRVANAIAKDSTGDIKLTLWNDDIDKVRPGDKIHLTNGYVSEWQGEMQLSTGRAGKLEVMSESKEEKEEFTKAPDEEENKSFYEKTKKRTKEAKKKIYTNLREEPEYAEEEIEYNDDEIE